MGSVPTVGAVCGTHLQARRVGPLYFVGMFFFRVHLPLCSLACLPLSSTFPCTYVIHTSVIVLMHWLACLVGLFTSRAPCFHFLSLTFHCLPRPHSRLRFFCSCVVLLFFLVCLEAILFFIPYRAIAKCSRFLGGN